MAPPLASGVLAAKCSMAVLLLVFSSMHACHAAQNITAILAALPDDFGEFSNLLTSAGLADDINQRNDGPVTVLAVNNTDMAYASLKPPMPREAIRSRLSLHVLLDCYYDDAKLQRLPLNSTAVVSTLFHAAGDAPGVYGMVRIGKYDDGMIGFMPMAGAVDGIGKDAFFVKSLYGAPYTMSVLQVYGVMAPISPDPARRFKKRHY